MGAGPVGNLRCECIRVDDATRARLSATYTPGVIRKLAPTDTIEFLTDVEGNWEYFVQYVFMSKVLYWEGDEAGLWGPGNVCLRDTGIFVFGGDAVDKGTGDIRFVKILLSLKERY